MKVLPLSVRHMILFESMEQPELKIGDKVWMEWGGKMIEVTVTKLNPFTVV